jgi:hypothetical protein
MSAYLITAAGVKTTTSIMNFALSNLHGAPVSTEWRRKDEWRWQRPS